MVTHESAVLKVVFLFMDLPKITRPEDVLISRKKNQWTWIKDKNQKQLVGPKCWSGTKYEKNGTKKNVEKKDQKRRIAKNQRESVDAKVKSLGCRYFSSSTPLLNFFLEVLYGTRIILHVVVNVQSLGRECH